MKYSVLKSVPQLLVYLKSGLDPDIEEMKIALETFPRAGQEVLNFYAWELFYKNPDARHATVGAINETP